MHPSIYAERNPDKPAYIMAKTGEVISYRQLNEKSNQVAHLLRHLDLQPNDHIAMLMENCRQFFEVVWGAQRSGLIYTAISTHLKKDEIAYILNNSGARALFVSEAYTDLITCITQELPDLKHRIIIGNDAEGYINYTEKMSEMPSVPVSDECAGTDMLYSSGTTGCPKGVTVSLSGEGIDTVPAVMAGMISYYGLDEDTVYLSPAPLYHAAPLRFNMITMLAGGTCIVMNKFDAGEALHLIDKYKVTHAQWVPVMFSRMLQLPDYKKYNVTSLKVAIHSAAPCPPDIKLKMIEWWGPIFDEFYSCTEGVGLTSINTQEWLSHQKSVGKAKVGEIHILDDNGIELESGQVGNIYFAGGPEFSYYKDPEKTAEAKNDAGWFSVGDMGYMDKDGYLYLTDRKSFMIISGGVNIYPQEVENLLITHPSVADVAVIGIPNSDLGEEVKAIVELRDGEEANEGLSALLVAYCRENLSHVKCPKSVDFCSNLPRFPNGKLYKKKIRDYYWSSEKRPQKLPEIIT